MVLDLRLKSKEAVVMTAFCFFGGVTVPRMKDIQTNLLLNKI